MVETIGRAGIEDERSDIRWRIARERSEIVETSLRPGHIAPEPQAFDWTHCAGQFNALGSDFAGECERSRAQLDCNIAPGDVIGGEGPLRPIVPQELFDAGLVDLGARQGQAAICRAGGEEAGAGRIIRRGVLAVERQVVDRFEGVSRAIGDRPPCLGERGDETTIEVAPATLQRVIINANAPDQRQRRCYLQTVFERNGNVVDQLISDIWKLRTVKSGCWIDQRHRVERKIIGIALFDEGYPVSADLKLSV